MVDFASMLFGDFQDSIVTTFGDTIGWVVGHALIAGLVALVWYTWIGRITFVHSQVGDARNRDIATILAVTMAQYIVYTGNLDYPEGPSLALHFPPPFSHVGVNVLN